jgi:hypothetical protein
MYVFTFSRELSYFRENFFTKIDENGGHINYVATWGMGHKIENCLLKKAKHYLIKI